MLRLSTPFTLLLALVSTAQPIIQNGNNLPQPGFSVGRSEGNTNLEEGPAGADQTWDFSSMVLINNAQPYIVLQPAASEYAAVWPTANYVATYSDAGNDRYFYYNVLADRLEAVADNVSNPSSNTVYNANPRTKLKFPFAFGETVTDEFTSPTSTQTVTLTYDAYGTLITPNNTFAQVVRIRWNVGNGDPRFDWWTLDPLLPVFQYTNGYVVQWADPFTSIGEQAGSGTASIHPNPISTSGTLTVDATTVAAGAHVTLLNAMGQVVRTTSLTSTTTTLERDGLAAGLYGYRVYTGTTLAAAGRLLID